MIKIARRSRRLTGAHRSRPLTGVARSQESPARALSQKPAWDENPRGKMCRAGNMGARDCLPCGSVTVRDTYVCGSVALRARLPCGSISPCGMFTAWKAVAVWDPSPRGITAVWPMHPHGIVTAWEHSLRGNHGRTDLSLRENPGHARSFTMWGLGIVYAVIALEGVLSPPCALTRQIHFPSTVIARCIR